MDNLCKRLEKLVSVDPTELNLRAVRSLLKKHHNELGHIKTAGKGRNKTAIMKDLKQWLKNTKVVTCDQSDDEAQSNPFPNCSESIVPFNWWAHGWLEKLFSKKDKAFADKIQKEHEENGDFDDWEDVERRVIGFTRSMITNRNAYRFTFNKIRTSLFV